MGSPNQLDIEIDVGVKAEALQGLELGLQRQIVVARALGKAGTEELAKLEASLASVRAQIATTGDTSEVMGRQVDDSSQALESFGRRGGEGRRAAMELDMVMRGGTESIFGMAGAWRSLTMAMAENPFTAILAVAVAIVPAVKSVFEKIAGASEEANKRMFEDIKKTGEEHKKQMEEMHAATDTAFHAIELDVDAGAASYKGLADAIELARQRTDTLNKAQLALELSRVDLAEQKALAAPGADTAEVKRQADRQRAGIRSIFGGVEMSNEEGAARLEKDAAQREIEQQQANIDEAARAAADARSTAQEKRDEMEGARAHGQMPDEAGVRAAVDADDAAKRAENDAEKVKADAQKKIAEAEKRADAAQLQLDTLAIKRETAHNESTAQLLGYSREDKKTSEEKADEAGGAAIDAKIGKLARKPEEAEAVAHVREQAEKVAEGATAAGLKELGAALMKLANAAVEAKDKAAQEIAKLAYDADQAAERLRILEQQSRNRS